MIAIFWYSILCIELLFFVFSCLGIKQNYTGKNYGLLLTFMTIYHLFFVYTWVMFNPYIGD